MTRAIVIGRAASVWDELKAVQLMAPFDFVVAVNVSGVDYAGPIRHWVTFHVLDLDKWVKRRQDKGYATAEHYWTSPSQKKLQPRTCYPLEYINVEGGSSGFLATCVALREADKVVLVGIPMESQAGQYDTNRHWDEASKHRYTWEKHMLHLLGKVKSVSGWTQEKLGAPTPEWLGV